MSEMSVEVQVGSVVVDAASVAHASRHKHGGLDPIATETPGAYAIPKADATGKLAAGFIPMGLISGGISTLDDLSDGSSYKRIAAAVATALNAGTYDAPKCTAFGIGDVKSLAEGYNIDTLFANGRYSVTRPTITGGGNFSSTGTYTIDVMKSSDGACIQLICRNGSVEFKFRRYDTVSWYTGSIWNALNDGNGGQPPAPKPRGEGTGLWYFVESATTPNVSGAVYAVLAFTSAGAFLGALPSQAANTNISAVLATTAKLFYYRTA